MNLLFCHDGPIQVDKDGDAYPQSYSKEVLARYYTIADHITMVMRTKVIDPQNAKFAKANMEHLTVVSSPNLASVNGILKGRRKTKKLLRNEMQKCDYLIARLPSHIGNIAIDLARELKKPYLVELVTCPWDALWNYNLKGKIVAPFMYYETKKRVRNANYVIYVTNEFLQKRYPTNGMNTNCSNVSLSEFNETTLISRLNKINNMTTYNGKRMIIGTTAAVDVRFKGQQYIIEALGKLKEQGNTNFEYHLVGGGNQEYLRSVAKRYNVTEQVKFLGALRHDDVFEWLDEIDLYTQPSRQEGLPRALIEAMSRGLPAFGAKTAGIPELLDSKFIFSNTSKNIDEICNILEMFDKKTMVSQAKRNYNESKNYESRLIEERRSKFFKEFARAKEYKI